MNYLVGQLWNDWNSTGNDIWDQHTSQETAYDNWPTVAIEGTQCSASSPYCDPCLGDSTGMLPSNAGTGDRYFTWVITGIYDNTEADDQASYDIYTSRYVITGFPHARIANSSVYSVQGRMYIWYEI